MISAEDVIRKFDLQRHPEGGYFKEAYRSSEIISREALPSRYNGDRSFSTSIYFLLPSGTVSRLHRIASDEVWHFYLGGPLELLQISPNGKMEKLMLGQDVAAGQKVQHVVPAGYWFGARPADGSAYSFVGCTVAPGFDFADFELADPRDLSRSFPLLRKEILLFC
jgi:predicted cupin superfamily sugar epimerase